ncbi:MAG: 2'-5' RNA ligase family protein [Chitinophagaceae bacterium]|nr:MAG: 2'-5' RNA ligase family protein [Chitinophagaceae bacterium]
MQTQSSSEYLLVAYPDKTVMDKILAERFHFTETYKVRLRPQLRPHVPVTHFFASEGMEPTLVRWLQKICRMEQGFNLTLNNYSGFPSHTIYIRLQHLDPLQHFLTQLTAMTDFVEPAHGIYRNRPHISLAGNLPASVYELALSDYSRRIFHESFQVKELVLLGRKDSFESFKTVQVFGLLPANNDLFNKVA